MPKLQKGEERKDLEGRYGSTPSSTIHSPVGGVLTREMDPSRMPSPKKARTISDLIIDWAQNGQKTTSEEKAGTEAKAAVQPKSPMPPRSTRSPRPSKPSAKSGTKQPPQRSAASARDPPFDDGVGDAR